MNDQLTLIAGPCVIESKELLFEVAEEVKKISKSLNIKYIFKASFDKANRSSYSSFRGFGLKKGLQILEEVKIKYGLEILTDIGLIGFLISCLIFILTIYNSLIKNYFLKPRKSINIILVPFIFVFISEIFPIRTSGSFFTTSTATFIFLLISIIISLSEQKTNN